MKPELNHNRTRAGLVFACLAGCFLFMLPPGMRAQPPGPVVKIGVMGPLTGPAAAYGLSQINGVTLAVEEINRNEKLPGGATIELVVSDDQGQMGRVANLLVPMIHQDEILALIGCINSACTHVAQMVTAKAHVPMITTTSTDPSITFAGSPYTFRCLADDRAQGKAIAHYLFNVKSYKRVALINQDNRYGKMGARTIEEIAAGLGRTVPVRALFAGDQTDFSDIIGKLEKERPDAVVIWGLYKGSALLVRAIKDAGLTMPVHGSDGLVSPRFVEIAGDAAEGIIVTYPFDPDRDNPLTRLFVKRFEKRFGTPPDSFAAHSYDAAYLLARAIQRSQALDRVKLKDALLETKGFPGVTGTISFDENGNDTRDVILAKIHDASFVPLRF